MSDNSKSGKPLAAGEKPHRTVEIAEDGLSVDAVEVFPGVFVSRKILRMPQKHTLGLVHFVTDPATGEILRVVTAWERPLRITLKNYEQWGLGGSYETFYKLVRAGFIRARRITPEVLEIIPSSLLAHIRNTEVTGYWTKARRERYRMATFDTLRPVRTRAEIEQARKRRQRKKRHKQDSDDQSTFSFI